MRSVSIRRLLAGISLLSMIRDMVSIAITKWVLRYRAGRTGVAVAQFDKEITLRGLICRF